MLFVVFMALFVIILNFLRWNLPNFSQHIASSRIQILNTKKSRDCKWQFFRCYPIYIVCLLPLPTNWSYRFPWKMNSDYSKIFINSLSNFTEFHWRKLKKIHSQFCFLCLCWQNKITKNTDFSLWVCADYLKFRPQRVCDRKTIGSHLKSILSLTFYFK